MKHTLNPTLDDLRLECLLMQAWKKTSSYLRTHSWYADTLGLDYQSLRIPRFIGELQDALRSPEHWDPTPIHLILAPKSHPWKLLNGTWQPEHDGYNTKLRPLAHVDLRDQVVATAVLLCLADRVETHLGDSRLPISSSITRKQVLAYGHRLVCDREGDTLRHRWGSSKLYRQYSQDYQTFLERPRQVAHTAGPTAPGRAIATVHSDISKFYDRVRPIHLHQKVRQFQRPGDDPRFFALVERLFDWRWSDTSSEQLHTLGHGLDGSTGVALPQGLVASGFFANVFLQDFDRYLRNMLEQAIGPQPTITLLDVSYYVDDLRIVLEVPCDASEHFLADTIIDWLNSGLENSAPGLAVDRRKTHVNVEGRDGPFLVPQSHAATRIQREVSGPFDMLHGTELIGAIEGFFHTQLRYSSNSAPLDAGRPGLLVGTSDMRDETAARFAAGRFRRTFRALRPLLADDEPPLGQAVAAPEEDPSPSPAASPALVLSKAQLDERAKLFAGLLIEEWVANPANIRLLRIALDMYPDSGYLNEVLALLRPAWSPTLRLEPGREVRLYCLAELFRAGATETGIVSDADCLPHGASVHSYHTILTTEAQHVFNEFVRSRKATPCLPWYLMQQVFLYLAVRDAFPEPHARLTTKGGPLLAMYRRYARFLATHRSYRPDENAIFLVIARTGFDNSRILATVTHGGLSPSTLSHINECSPTTSAEVWELHRSQATRELRHRARQLGLEPRPPNGSESDLPMLASRPRNPFLIEVNLLHLADWLLRRPAETFSETITPWHVSCKASNPSDDFGDVDFTSFSLIPSSHVVTRLFDPPDWCDTLEDRRRFQIGALLRFAIRGSTELFSSVHRRGVRLLPRYSRPISHWQQQRYAGFQGRPAFGPPWIPLSTFTERLLFDLLRWPGSGVTTPPRSLAELAAAVSAESTRLMGARGIQSGTLFLTQHAQLPFKPAVVNWERSLRIGVVQTVLPDDGHFLSHGNDPALLSDPAFRHEHRAHLAAVIEGVAQMIRVRETHRSQFRLGRQTIDLLIFPELAVHPDDLDPIILPFVRTHRCIALFGKVYHHEPRLPTHPLLNTCQWVIPEWTPASGLQIRHVEQGKKHIAKPEMSLNPAPQSFRPTQWLIEYQWQSNQQISRPLVLTASVCYDATDLTLASDLRDRSDLYIVVALNRDVGTFDRMSEGLHYHMYQGVIVVNNGRYGGSSFYLPFEKPFHRQIFHLHGQPQVSIAFAELSPQKLIQRGPDGRSGPASMGLGGPSGPLEGDWKTPPAGWMGR